MTDTQRAALDDRQAALHALARWLAAQDYRFVTVTPETHRRVLARRSRTPPQTLRDVFGWNMAFAPADLPAHVLQWLNDAGAIDDAGSGLARSRVRFATLRGTPYVHSAFPTSAADAVFFGPDTYRFANLIEQVLQNAANVHRVLDVGCGAGAGGLVAACVLAATGGQRPEIELADINPRALEFAAVNAATFGRPDVELRCANLFDGTQPGLDLIVSNPPYLLDADQRVYRHGGGASGSALSEQIVRDGLPLLSEGGKLVLYTGSAIRDGHDAFREAALDMAGGAGFQASYRELDPDVFGEELEHPGYSGVERIAAVALTVERVSAAMGGAP